MQRRQHHQVSVIEEVLNVAWESEDDDDDSDIEQLFPEQVIAESTDTESTDEEGERVALEADDEDGERAALQADDSDFEMEDVASDMDVDVPQAPQDSGINNSTILTYLRDLTSDTVFHAFAVMVPAKEHKALWRATFQKQTQWWYLLCVFWEKQLRYAFFPHSDPNTVVSLVVGASAITD